MGRKQDLGKNGSGPRYPRHLLVPPCCTQTGERLRSMLRFDATLLKIALQSPILLQIPRWIYPLNAVVSNPKLFPGFKRFLGDYKNSTTHLVLHVCSTKVVPDLLQLLCCNIACFPTSNQYSKYWTPIVPFSHCLIFFFFKPCVFEHTP